MTEHQEVRVCIEGDVNGIYVGEDVIRALRGTARRQLSAALLDVSALIGDLDDTDIEQIGNLQYAVGWAGAAVGALLQLAPLPDDDDE